MSGYISSYKANKHIKKRAKSRERLVTNSSPPSSSTGQAPAPRVSRASVHEGKGQSIPSRSQAVPKQAR